MDPASYYQWAVSSAQHALVNLGYSPQYAHLLAAIGASESNYGNTPGYALFGIKCDPARGACTEPLTTWEWVNGQRVATQARFQAYATPADAFEGWVHFLEQNPRYSTAVAQMRAGAPPEQVIQSINAAGYATNPTWWRDILALLPDALRFGGDGDPLLPPVSEPDTPPPATAPETNTGVGSVLGFPNLVQLAPVKLADTPLGPFSVDPTGLANVGGRLFLSAGALVLIGIGVVALAASTPAGREAIQTAKTAVVAA